MSLDDLLDNNRINEQLIDDACRHIYDQTRTLMSLMSMLYTMRASLDAREELPRFPEIHEVMAASDIACRKFLEALGFDMEDNSFGPHVRRHRTNVFSDPELRAELRKYRDEMSRLVACLQETIEIQAS